MSWSSELFCNISFNRQTYNSKYEVESAIEDLKVYIRNAENKIRNLVMITEPNKYTPEDYDPITYLTGEFEEALELIKEYEIDLYKLNLLLDNWDTCHDENGLAINHPDNISWNSAFLDGDFIKSEKHPNGYE